MQENENNSNLPQQSEIPEFLQGDNWFQEDTSGLYLDFTKPYKPPKWTLSHNGIPFAKLGDIHVISGKAGHGKTALMSQFMATLLSGSFGHLKSELTDPTILYIDTEQSEDDTIAIKNRVCSLAKIPFDKPNERFKVVRLRETEEASERWRQILKVIWEVRPTVCFLDGMLDVVNDYNDQVECQPIIRKCMKLVTHYNMSLWCVLHENPMAEKMVGTLGSILQRKVTEVLAIRKHKHEKEKYPNMPDIFFEVVQPKARGRDQDDWYFKIESVESWGVPIEIDNTGSSDKETREQREVDELLKKFNWTSKGATYTEIENFLRAHGNSGRRASTVYQIAMEAGIIYKTDNRKYYYKGLGRQRPDDTQGDLPFDKPEGNEPPF